MSESKCEMARQKLCRKSEFGYCVAEGRDLATCPYLKSVIEIARLTMENMRLEDKLMDDGK